MKEQGIDVWEYLPYQCPAESLEACILRVNKFFGIDECPYDVPILEKLINERHELRYSMSPEYWENRYEYYKTAQK